MMVGIVGGLTEQCRINWHPDGSACACARCFIARQYRNHMTSDERYASAPLIRRTAWLPRKVSL